MKRAIGESRQWVERYPAESLLLAAGLGRAAGRIPANRNVKWGLGSNLWNYFPRVPFTDILDVMKDTGFIGLRLTQFPQLPWESAHIRHKFGTGWRGLVRSCESYDIQPRHPAQDRHESFPMTGSRVESAVRAEAG